MSPRGQWQGLETGCHKRGRGVLLASGRQSPGLLLPVLWCTGRPLPRDFSAPNVRGGQVENPGLHGSLPFSLHRVASCALKGHQPPEPAGHQHHQLGGLVEAERPSSLPLPPPPFLIGEVWVGPQNWRFCRFQVTMLTVVRMPSESLC